MNFYKQHVAHIVLTLVYQHLTESQAVINSSEAHNFYHMPGLLDVEYSNPGDINIGAVMIVTTASSDHPAESCSKEWKWPQYSFENTEAVAFAVDLVNRNPDILPNVTLGFVILGSCLSPGVTMATSMLFLPRSQQTSFAHCSQLDDFCWQSHDVIGILAPGFSSLSTPISSLYAVVNVPMVGPTESSDALSDKDKHPYFFRVATPDVYLVQGILNFLSSNHWSYVSVLYVDDVYGQNAFDKLQQNVKHYGICVATSHRLGYMTDYDKVVSALLVHPRARAVVVFLFGDILHKILQAVVDRNVTGHFIFVGYVETYLTHGFQYPGTNVNPGAGVISFDFYSPQVTGFTDHLRDENVVGSTNPWMKPFWEYLFDCSFANATCDPEADMFESSKYQPPNRETPSVIDSVLALAHGAHDLLIEKCPDARGDDVKRCFDGKLLREYMKNTTFDGFLGHIEFDENQEVRGKYSIIQFVPCNNSSDLISHQIGIYDVSTERISYASNTTFSWSYHAEFDRVVYFDDGLQPIEIPESVCSRPCIAGEYKIEKELPCCWECRRCRDNERLINGNTSCEPCRQFMWPDPLSAFTNCIDIPPSYSTLDDSVPILLLSLTLLALVIDGIITITYIIYRNERVIKASSRELSAIQLVAILGGYVNVILFQIKPTQITCTVIFFLFCMTFVMLYSPLLVKTIRIYRIFQSGKTNKQNLRFISPGSQVIVTVCLIAVQAALSIANYVLFSPGAHRTQPIWSEKYVELSCDLTLPGLASFLGYNIILVSLCSIFAFKTRKLPDNFNESQFISMCVSTTLLIWLAFIPTYFTADREFVRVFLLSVALLLNHSVALIFLFLPKLYAAIFLPAENGNESCKKS